MQSSEVSEHPTNEQMSQKTFMEVDFYFFCVGRFFRNYTSSPSLP